MTRYLVVRENVRGLRRFTRWLGSDGHTYFDRRRAGRFTLSTLPFVDTAAGWEIRRIDVKRRRK